MKKNQNLITDFNENTRKNVVKRRESIFHISAESLHKIEVYYNNLSSICKSYSRYSIIVRLCFISNYVDNSTNVTDWKTLGEQISLYYEDSNSLFQKVTDLKGGILDRLDYIRELYSIHFNEIAYLQFLVYNVDYNDVIIKKSLNLSSLGDHKDMINQSKTNKDFHLLPLSNNVNDFGVKLEKSINNGVVDVITLIDGERLKFSYLVSQYSNKDIKFTDEFDFYQNNLKDKTLIIVVNTTRLNHKSINNISIFTKSGVKLCDIKDDNVENNNFKRSIGNVLFEINNGIVINKEIKKEFYPIHPKKVSTYLSNMDYSNYKFGTMDLETYVDKYGISKVYALGFYIKNDTNNFYINEDLNSDELIKRCINSMLKEKYDKYTFYVHNFGRFDVTFILRVIISLQENEPDIYNFDLVLRDGVIICMNISKNFYYSEYNKKSKRSYSIKLVDSYNLLHNSLYDLCKTYKPTVTKTYFPYNFVKENTLFYTGITPNIGYYNNINNEQYKSLIDKNWSTKNETLKYLSNDLISLFDIMEVFTKHIWLNYGVHISNSYTISGLSMDIFLRNYYDKNIPLINNKSVHNDIRKSYYGGITEVYKPFGENLYYYDVNSLYPYAALNDMPGIKCTFIEKINKNISEFEDDLFGFYYCKIETNNNYIGLIPVRQNNGSIYMPEGTIEGWYFSEELKFASKHGYNITILYGYKFNRSKDVFTKYIKDFYKIKSETNDYVEKATAKSLLNNLLGRFGMNINKPITKLLDDEEFAEILQTRTIIGDIKHIGDKKLVSFDSNISQEICEKNDVDFIKTYNNLVKTSDSRNEKLTNVSVCISSAVTAYSRIFMNKIKLDILNKKGSIYYTDTDSIVTNIPLESNLIGNELGKFKLEHFIKTGYFLSNKTYCLVKEDDSTVIKVKGVNSNKLNLDDFKNMYLGMDIKTTRMESTRNYNEGYTNINVVRDITLSAQSYKKRLKILNNNNIWVDTKPHTINMWGKRSYSVFNSINIISSIRYFWLTLLSYLAISIPYLLIILLCLILNINEDIITMDLDANHIIEYGLNKDKNKIYINPNKPNIYDSIYNRKLINVNNTTENISNKTSKTVDMIKEMNYLSLEQENNDLKKTITNYKINDQMTKLDIINIIKDLNQSINDIKNNKYN